MGPAGNVASPSLHLRRVIAYIRQAWPFFNRSSGADHFVWLPGDFGACGISAEVRTLPSTWDDCVSAEYVTDQDLQETHSHCDLTSAAVHDV